MTAVQTSESVSPIVWTYWKLQEAAQCPPPRFRDNCCRRRRDRFLIRVRKRMRELWVTMSDRERQMADPKPVPHEPHLIIGADIDARTPRSPSYGTRLRVGFAWMNG